METTLAVHRCRFIDFTPSAITALAFPPLPLPSVKGKKPASRQHLRFGTLAVGHANGNIDLCEWCGIENEVQSSQAWVIRKTLSGSYPSKVDSLVFTIRYPETLEQDGVPSLSDLRLFSSGGGSELLEWDLGRGCIRRTINSQGGSIWSAAVNPDSTLLALGCEDGTVRLLSLIHDSLTHYRRFDRVKCRLLSIAWGPPIARQGKKAQSDVASGDSSEEDDEDEWNDSWLVTGGSDSSLRKWDVSTGRVIDRMGTDKIRGERTLVWTVGVLGDGTIVSGDSLGMVKFWDSRTGTQLESFQAHGADVLCLTIGPEGTTVYTSGVDQKISQFSLVKTSIPNAVQHSVHRSSSRWALTGTRRMHSHDVRALATWPPYTTLPQSHKRHFPIDIAPILASGGLDMSVVVTPVALPTSTVVKVVNPLLTSMDATFEDSYHRRLAYSSGPSSTSAISVARKARLVSCTQDAELSIWRILRKQSSSSEDLTDPAQGITESGGWEKVLDMELNVATNLVASAISDDGRWLVASDLYETKLFSLVTDTQGGLKPKRVREFSALLKAHLPKSSTSTGGLAFSFTPNSSKLVMSTAMSSFIIVIELGTDGQAPRVLRRFDHHHRYNADFRNRVVKGRINGEDASIAGAEAEADPDESDNETLSAPVVSNILRIAISADGQWFAASDERCRTHVFNLDSIQHHCSLPTFPLPAQALSFDPTHPSLLIMAFPNNTLQIYNVESRQFPAWSRDFCNNLPKRFTHAHDPILGVAFDPAVTETPATTPRYALFWGSTWLCKLKLDDTVHSGSSKKRRRESKRLSPPPAETSYTTPMQNTSLEDQQPRDFKMITQYRPILYVDFLAAGELLVVERPLVDVLATLPPAYFKHKYGT